MSVGVPEVTRSLVRVGHSEPHLLTTATAMASQDPQTLAIELDCGSENDPLKRDDCDGRRDTGSVAGGATKRWA